MAAKRAAATIDVGRAVWEVTPPVRMDVIRPRDGLG